MSWWGLPLLLVLFAASAGLCGDFPSLPDKEGFAGSFAGVSHGALMVAGGANFPGKKPWDGGQKVWYDEVFVLERPDAPWKAVGKLPRPLGYGVSVTHQNGVVCVGGSDSARHYADVFRLEWTRGKLEMTELPALPKPLANSCGALVGDFLYVAGGLSTPNATATEKAVYRIDLSKARPKWEEIEPCPGGGRMLAVAAGFDGAFWLFSGVDLVAGAGNRTERKYLVDAYRYAADKGWKRIADLPHPVVAAPTPTPTDTSAIYVLGGDDGTQVGVAHDKHRGFSTTVHRYDARFDRWVKAGELAAPRVTAPCVAWAKSWVVPSGEIRPGVRSPAVTVFIPPSK